MVRAMLEMVEVAAHPPERFESVLEPEPFEKLAAGIGRARELLDGRTIWNVSSTAKGGGVVELLLPLIGYAKGAGVDARWAVIEGNPAFFTVTKRIHNHLHGFEGDGGALDDEARKTYEDALEANARELVDLVDDNDIVLLHDPQTAGLIGPLKRTGAKVIWRCHIGVDEPDDLARGAWDFLRVDVEQADAYVFSREAFVWEGLDDDKVEIIAPSIDAFNAKNQELDAEPGPRDPGRRRDRRTAAAGEPTFKRGDGSEARVESQAELFEDSRLTPDDTIVLQVSRWDRLKDPEGVIRGFAEHASAHETGAHLIYAGPAVDAVSDDPEGAEVLEEAKKLRDGARRRRAPQRPPRLPADGRRRGERGDRQRAPARRRRRRPEEHRRGLRAHRRRGDVEGAADRRHRGRRDPGPGRSTARPACCSRTRRTSTPTATPCAGLLEDPERAQRLGEAAKLRVRDEFLGARSLLDYLSLVAKLLA